MIIHNWSSSNNHSCTFIDNIALYHNKQNFLHKYYSIQCLILSQQDNMFCYKSHRCDKVRLVSHSRIIQCLWLKFHCSKLALKLISYNHKINVWCMHQRGNYSILYVCALRVCWIHVQMINWKYQLHFCLDFKAVVQEIPFFLHAVYQIYTWLHRFL